MFLEEEAVDRSSICCRNCPTDGRPGADWGTLAGVVDTSGRAGVVWADVGGLWAASPKAGELAGTRLASWSNCCHSGVTATGGAGVVPEVVPNGLYSAVSGALASTAAREVAAAASNFWRN